MRAYHYWGYNFSFLSELSSFTNRNEEKERKKVLVIFRNLIIVTTIIVVVIIIILQNKIFLQFLFCMIFRFLILVSFVIRSKITPKETRLIFAR